MALENYLEGRTVKHLFRHCAMTEILWRLFLNIKGLSWSTSGKITETLQSWEEAGIQAKSRSRWRFIPASIWRTIWKERSVRCFKNVENSIEQIKLNCILILWFWCNQIWSNDLVSIIDVLDSL
ncbi:uncharacterized protein LOC124896107 [Capsicum annuum]|uniref:uncharacterized protein LOC124896107 n=1 Tax=Capsicum annuum TaxID=4072 RepID=UPI001FB05F32|nr:uncharacterized protein LOC124896107 [Capsicum annuum]